MCVESVWNVRFVFCVVVCCTESLCVGVGAGAGVQCVCGVWRVARLGTRKTPVCLDEKRLRVYVQDVSVCTSKTPACVQLSSFLSFSSFGAF